MIQSAVILFCSNCSLNQRVYFWLDNHWNSICGKIFLFS